MLTWFATFGSLFGSAIALFAAVLATRASLRAHQLGIRSAKQQDRRGRSEETMRILRWGVELAVADQDRSVRAGVVVLNALVGARMVVPDDLEFVVEVSEGVTLNLRDHLQYAENDIYEHPEGGDDA